VYTEPVVLRVNGKRYQIGRFRMEIRPGERVTMRNLDRPIVSSRGRHAHPHVLNGKCCFGDAQSFFATKIAQHDFPAIIQAGLEFLCSYNPRDTFVDVDAWA